MVRRAFFSFHYLEDNWRASQIRNIGTIRGNKAVQDNDWEKLKRGGDKAIKKWIDSQLKGKSVAIVLVGENTANRKWINYEIKRAWELGKGVFGIHVHRLKDRNQTISERGENPFSYVKVDCEYLSSVVNIYSPFRFTSRGIYRSIENNLAEWTEEAIEIRSCYE